MINQNIGTVVQFAVIILSTDTLHFLRYFSWSDDVIFLTCMR